MEVELHSMPIKVNAYHHQRDAYDFVLRLYRQNSKHIGASLLMEMGTGKTLTAIAVAGKLYEALRINRLLIVAPLSILGVWKEEFEKFAAFPYTLEVLEGSGDQKREQISKLRGKGLQVLVVNYESCWRLEEEISDWAPDMIIADEGHKLKSHKTQASKAMHRLGAQARYKLLLTGTPITNKAIDIFSQYKFADSRVFGPSFYSFRTRFFNMTGYGNYTPVMKKEKEQEFMKRMHSIAFRARKADCLDLPEVTDIIHTIKLEPKAMKLYGGLVEESYAELSRGDLTVTNVLTKILRLSQLTGGFLSADDSSRIEQVSSAKLDVLSDLIDASVQEGQKLVVIARFVAEIEAIKVLLESKGIGYAVIAGGVTDREEQVSRFQNDPDMLVFIGQIATAGMGITLTAASTMVFYSMDYSMSNFEQAKARIHRAGQKYPCTYMYLIAENTRSILEGNFYTQQPNANKEEGEKSEDEQDQKQVLGVEKPDGNRHRIGEGA